MRIFTFLILAVMASFSLNAQVVVINSPASLEGAYVWTTGFGADLTSDIWTGDCIIVDDGTASPNLGCEASVIDYTDKIVLIDRGACQFGVKALNAQDNGALAVVIFNNQTGGPIPMGGGTAGPMVTIPTVMLSLEDGLLIKEAINNDVIVNMTIGALVFDNDISATQTSVTRPFSNIIPANQIVETGSARFTPIVNVSNNGNLEATNVVGEVNITYTPDGGSGSNVYSESASNASIPVDTSAFLEYPEFDFSGNGLGIFNLDYTIESDATDELEFDNIVSTYFTVSENIFCKGNWDYVTNRPTVTGGTGPAGGGVYSLLTPFHIPKGAGFSIDSLQFYMAVNSPDSMGGIAVNLNLYKWDDLVEDDSIAADEITRVGIATYQFPIDVSATAAWAVVGLSDAVNLTPGYVMPEDGGNYIVELQYTGTLGTFYGFNNNSSQALAINNQSLFETTMDLPYLVTTELAGDEPEWSSISFFGNTFGSSVVALYVNDLAVSTTTLSDLEAKVLLFPNPVSTVLNAEVTLEDKSRVEYRITDVHGKLISTIEKEELTEDFHSFDLSKLTVGQYFLTIVTDKGIKTEKFNVTR